MRRVWMVCAAVGLGIGLACAQTPASQANESQWKQTPEGRTPEAQQNMNCTGSASMGKDGKVTTTSNCPAAQDKPVPSNAAQQFPYPGDTPAANPQNPQTPNAGGAQSTPPNPAQQFPYPGEPGSSGSSSSSSSSPRDVKPAPPGGLQDAGSSGSSSSSSSSSGYSSSNADEIPDAGNAEPDDTSVPTRTRSSRRRPAQPVKTNSQQFAEDMEVAGFYQNDGNFRGAYMRAKDAVSLDSSDPDAHLALAEAARKLGKLDEAEQNYKRCLSLDPVPKTRKAAQEALKQMTGGS